jgi:hypothetical protein
MEVAENFLGPEIDSPFSGIAMREFDHSNALRPEKQEYRDDPQPDCDAAIRGDRRYHVQVKDRYYKQQDKVEATENALQMGLVDFI